MASMFKTKTAQQAKPQTLHDQIPRCGTCRQDLYPPYLKYFMDDLKYHNQPRPPLYVRWVWLDGMCKCEIPKIKLWLMQFGPIRFVMELFYGRMCLLNSQQMAKEQRQQ